MARAGGRRRWRSSQEDEPDPRPRLEAPRLILTLVLTLSGLALAAPGLLADPPTGPDKQAFDPLRFLWQMAAVLLLILLNAFFAIAEYALITVRKTRIRQLVEENNRSARKVQHMLENSTRMMATIQTGVTLIATLSSALAATTAVGPLAHWLRTHFSGFLHNNAGGVALVLVSLPVAIITLVVGEIAPKSLAVRNSERLALIAVHPVYWLETILSPVVAALTWLANLLLKPFGGTASFTTPVVNEEEIKILVDASEEQGVLESEETEMIHSILDFADTVVRKVMTPRIDLTAFDVNGSLDDLIALVNRSGHSRIPVYQGDLDNIVGIVHAKDLLGRPTQRARIRDVMRPAYFIPETKKVDDLLREFRRSRQQIAIVRDEYGVTAGLVTIEDLLEEIVGDIQDEYDLDEPMVHVIDPVTTIVDGRMSIGDVNDRLDLKLPEDEADTIGGFVFGLLGHQAEQGERASFDGVDFAVEATDGRRITKVRLCRKPMPPGPLEESQREEPVAIEPGGTAE